MVISVCLAFSALANAQDNQSKPDSLASLHDSLKEVTITATRTTKDIMDVGRSVTVISSEQIKQASCNTVAELLSQQEGIYIVGTGQNPGAIESLFMRGADNNNTTIMVDGVPLIDPSTDHSQIDLSELSLAGVDRIEIVRGSHSTLYGSSSIGGVINIITKKNYTPGFHISASATGGVFGSGTQYGDGSIFVNYTLKNGFYATAGYHRIADNGLNATIDTFSTPVLYHQENPDADNYNKSESFGKIGFVNKKWDVYGEYRNVIQNSDADGGPFTDLKNATDHFVRDFYICGINYKINKNFQLQYISSYSHNYRIYNQALDTDIYGGLSIINNMYKGIATTNEIKAEYDIKTSHIIIGGGSNAEAMHLSENNTYNGSLYENNPDSVKFQQTIYNIYAQADVNGGTFKNVLAPYSLLIGMRYSNNSRFGDNLSYEINPYYKINKNSMLFLSYSTGFNAPSLYQTYSPSTTYGSDPSITIGNSKLTPETSNSLEIGVKHRVSNSVFFTLSWFKTEVNNYVDYVALWTKNKPVDSLGYSDFMGNTYLNVGQQINEGFEVSASVRLSEKVEVSGNISLISGTLKYSQSTVDTDQTHGYQVQIYDGGAFLYGNKTQENGLLRRPGSLGNFAFTYHPIKKVALMLRARYVGSRYDAQYDYTLGPYGAVGFATVGDYTLLDAFISYNYDEHLSAMLRCENVFNTKYSEILGYTTRGRGFYLNLRYSL